jgi:hypothetical protein
MGILPDEEMMPFSQRSDLVLMRELSSSNHKGRLL